MDESNTFSDNTIVSTPQPISSSTVQKKKRKDEKLDEIPKRLSVFDSSLEEILKECDRQATSATFKLESEKTARLSTLPSRFLRPSEHSNDTETMLKVSESHSTISESDLSLDSELPPNNTSTPRVSALDTEECKRRMSCLSGSLARLSLALTDNDLPLDQFLEEFRKTMEMEVRDSDFKSAEAVEAQLLADEMAWRNRMDIPAEKKDFSLEASRLKASMSSFFKGRSEDISQLLSRTPEKKRFPIPLIEVLSPERDSDRFSNVLEGVDGSLSVSAIAKILSDTGNTSSKAIDCLLNPNKKKDSEGREKKSSPKRTNKENVDLSNIRSSSPDFGQNRSVGSARSCSSLSNLADGKLPIESTKSEIVWGCVKLGKSVSTELVIRNKSSSRLRIQCSLSNPAFQINKDRSEVESLTSLKLVLHPHESRTLSVSFAPVAVGASVDEIVFTSLDPRLQQTKKQFIRLYGYGGCSNVSIQSIVKDVTGKFLLSLGNIHNEQDIEKKFSVHNSGNLPAFVYITFAPKSLYSFSKLTFKPDRFVLSPQERKQVVVRYIANKEDLKFLQSSNASAVIDMGTLKVVCEAEVIRGRIRRLCRKAAEKKLDVDSLSDKLKEPFPGEQMPSDLKLFVESVASMKELLQFLSHKEIVVTVEQDPDRTLTPQFPDETSMFHTLCQENTTVLENTVYSSACKVEPTSIILTRPGKAEDMIFLFSTSEKDLQFEAKSSPEGLNLQPRRGVVTSKQTAVIKLRCDKTCAERTVFKVAIHVNGEVLEVDVKVLSIGGAKI